VAVERDPTSGESENKPAGEPAERRTRSSPAPPQNAVEFGRNPRKSREAAQEWERPLRSAPAAAETASSTEAPKLARADSDPWTVPQSVRDRFVQDGHRFYFPDGHPAFQDRGRKLTTGSENTQVVRSLIEIAESRGWTEVTVTGTERFREEAWRQARLAGLNVRGFRPTDEQQAQLVRTLARTLVRTPERVDAVVEGAVPAAPQPTVSSPAPGAVRIAGQLVDHGRDGYRHDPNEDPSYFVRLKTGEGEREVWGRDIERAVAKSLTRPQIGDEVVLLRTGQDAVTVTRRGADIEGRQIAKAIETHRNRWVLEKREFLESRGAAAETVRNESIAPKEGVREHPELAGTYLNLKAAELASKSLRDPEDQQQFVRQVRLALARSIEHGEPLQPVRLKERRPEVIAVRQPRSLEAVSR